MTDANRLVRDSHVVGRLGGRQALHWCFCRRERRCVGFGEKETSSYVCLLLAAGEDAKMQSD